MLNDENYTSFAVSVLVHKMGEGEGGAYFKFWPIGGAIIRRGRLFEGGANSRIYGKWSYCIASNIISSLCKS